MVAAMQDALGEVPKSKFPEVFARYKGSTGTLLSAAKTEEYYAITWTSPKTQIYELPTGEDCFFFVQDGEEGSLAPRGGFQDRVSVKPKWTPSTWGRKPSSSFVPLPIGDFCCVGGR